MKYILNHINNDNRGLAFRTGKTASNLARRRTLAAIKWGKANKGTDVVAYQPTINGGDSQRISA